MANRDLQDEMPSLDNLTTWLLGTLFFASSLALYGDLNFSAFGYDVAEWLMTPLYEFGESGLEVAYAHIISLGAIAGVYVGTSDKADISDFADHQGRFAIGTVALVVLTIASPEFVDWATATDSRAMVLVGVLTLGYLAITEAKDMAARGWI